jgi:hypothetical protein
MEATFDLNQDTGVGPALGDSICGATLCVHFSSRATEHGIWFAEPAPEAEVDASRVGRMSVVWRELPDPLLRGYARLGRDVVCDCFLLPGSTPADDRRMLRAQGVGREAAAIIARMPQRPLLATFGRGGELPPPLVRRFQRLLLWTAATCSPHRRSSITPPSTRPAAVQPLGT